MSRLASLEDTKAKLRQQLACADKELVSASSLSDTANRDLISAEQSARSLDASRRRSQAGGTPPRYVASRDGAFHSPSPCPSSWTYRDFVFPRSPDFQRRPVDSFFMDTLLTFCFCQRYWKGGNEERDRRLQAVKLLTALSYCVGSSFYFFVFQH